MYTAPLVVRDRVYIGANSRVVALDQETGDVVWRRDDLVPDDFPPCTNSPSACGGYIVVGFYGQPTNLMVLDAAIGKTVWTKAEGKPYDIYSTPVIDEDGTIYTVSAGAVRAYDLETGALKWEAPFTLNRVRATPALAEGRLFFARVAGRCMPLRRGAAGNSGSGVHAGTRRCLPLTRVKGASRLHHTGRGWKLCLRCGGERLSLCPGHSHGNVCVGTQSPNPLGCAPSHFRQRRLGWRLRRVYLRLFLFETHSTLVGCDQPTD